MPIFSRSYRPTRKLGAILVFGLLLCVSVFPFKINAQQNFNWANAFGGGETVGRAIVTDSAGNVYSTGYFSGTVDFDPGTGVTDKSSVAAEDIYISKLDANGNFLWVKTIGSNSYNEGHAIDVDLNGNIYITGDYAGTADFDPGVSVFNLVSNGGDEIFILKLDTQGNFIWAKSIGGPGFDDIYGVRLDVIGNVYTTGYFDGTVDFDPGTGVYNLTGAVDIFVLKLDVNGDFIWAKSMAGGDIDYGASLDVDTAGNVYTIGSFNLTVDFDPGASVYNLTSNGDFDFFISKLDKYGNFVWAKSDGGSNYDTGRSVCVDNKGNVFLTGGFRGYLGSYNLNSSGNDGAYISKLDTAGNLMWAKKLSGSVITGYR